MGKTKRQVNMTCQNYHFHDLALIFAKFIHHLSLFLLMQCDLFNFVVEPINIVNRGAIVLDEHAENIIFYLKYFVERSYIGE
jgi:hypothetical protein